MGVGEHSWCAVFRVLGAIGGLRGDVHGWFRGLMFCLEERLVYSAGGDAGMRVTGLVLWTCGVTMYTTVVTMYTTVATVDLR